MASSQSNNTSLQSTPHHLLWDLMRGFRGKYAWAIVSLFVFTVINYLPPLIASVTIDLALAENHSDSPLLASLAKLMGGPEFISTNLWFPALLMISLTLVAGAFSFLKDYFAARASDGLARNLKERLYNHLQRLPAAYHDRAETGDLIQRCTSDVETLRLALSTQVIEISNSILLLITVLPIMIAMDGRMTMVSFALIIPIIGFGYFYIGKVKHLFQEVDEAEGQVTRVVQENLTGLRVVRAFARQEFEMAKFAEPNQHYRDKSLRLLHLMAWYWSTSDLIVLFQQGLVLFVGIHFIANDTLTVGTLFAFLMFLNIFLWPVRQMGRTLTELGKSFVALTRMGEILAEDEESAPITLEVPKNPVSGAIEVNNLTFGYGQENKLLNQISFSIKPGETLAIVGPSGSGKTTIMSLLLRLYDYTEGSIRLDGHELNHLGRQWVRSQFSVVMQEPFLYSKTIQENIRLSQYGARDEEVTAAARLADIHDTIRTFSSGYSTLVGERGVTLSGGQRQRVAIARALLQQAPILLLDDALSAVDSETESHILEALKDRHNKRTTIVIAHRLSTLAHADKIIVLKEGQIIQSGTPQQLLAEEGLYQRLWKTQHATEP